MQNCLHKTENYVQFLVLNCTAVQCANSCLLSGSITTYWVILQYMTFLVKAYRQHCPRW